MSMSMSMNMKLMMMMIIIIIIILTFHGGALRLPPPDPRSWAVRWAPSSRRTRGGPKQWGSQNPYIRATETMLAETMLADLRARAARVCWCKCTGCTTKKMQLCS